MSMSIKCYMPRDDADADADGKRRLTSFPQVFHKFNRGRSDFFQKIFKNSIDIIFSLCYNGSRLKKSIEKFNRNFTIQKLYAHGRQGSVGFKSIYR